MASVEVELQHTLDRKRGELQQVAVKAGTAWLAPTAATEAGTEQLYCALERQLAAPEFEAELARSQHDLAGGQHAQQHAPAPGSEGCEVLAQDWWELKEDGELRVSEQTGDYVFVERDDVVRALAAFIAEYIVSLPEAQHMEPRQLQRAVVMTMGELRKGRVRRLLDWGRSLYRLGAVGYGAFSVFTNPWVAKAVLAALWSCVRLMGRIVL
ncbi:hypothetical protein C2E20_0693 [Micractinium conductrix]|uniref:Uncharacterized protein n=1 Tax=Micractinium conductrix TaxID=554055 RepID=A0A2P6VS42_9CHLO|nr:hypothetical protein C2E20_0693 [Micractinium conductrix]|eukprot:PSC76909.1 hypothetical protein C2E20_0693 [Micractinium conductrix]